MARYCDQLSGIVVDAQLQPQPWAYEAREFLRSHVVGKPVTFTVAHTLPSNDDTIREIGSAECQGVDITNELLKAGWAKLKEMKREPNEADVKRRELENEARNAHKGIWNPHGPKVNTSQAASLYQTTDTCQRRLERSIT